MHSQALTDPIYVAKLTEAEKATKGALGPFCKKCHAPAAMMVGQIDSKQPSAGVAGGIQCSFCHQVVGDTGAIANTSQLVIANKTYRAQLKNPKAPHRAATSAFLDSAAMCGGCHNVNHPIGGMHLEATYAEWKRSNYAKKGITCQDCHMSRGAGVIGPSKGRAAAGAPERPNIFTMTFTGANTELGDGAAATEMLRSAARMTMDAPDVLDGKPATVTVTIANEGAGHYLPTGLTEVREMWLEVYVQGADGKKSVVGERRFGTILQDAKGNAPVELWEATRIKSDDRIPPNGEVTQEYVLTMPAGVEAGTLNAVLNYRSTGDELAKKAGTKNPVTEMAAVSQGVYASVSARDALAQEDATQGKVWDWMGLIFLLVGVTAAVGIAIWFWLQARKIAA